MTLDTWIHHLNAPRGTSNQRLRRRLNRLCIGDSCHTHDLADLPDALIIRVSKFRLEVRQGRYSYLTNRHNKNIGTSVNEVLAHFDGDPITNRAERVERIDQPELL